MKKIIITGEKGYIASQLNKFLKNYPDSYDVFQISVKTDDWKKDSFKGVNSIVHSAAIVHRPGLDDWEEYKKVNYDLTVELAHKAKNEGVEIFVFISTMGIYGKKKTLSENYVETVDGIPTDHYSRSKYLAELELRKMESPGFRVIIVRPPSVYGYGCKGGYVRKFARMVRILPVIPKAYENVKQSFIYVDNLCEVIRLAIENNESMTITPQDAAPVSTCELMRAIALGMGLKRRESRLLGLAIYALSFLPIVNKAYGGVAYTEADSCAFDNKYLLFSFEEGMKRTIEGK